MRNIWFSKLPFRSPCQQPSTITCVHVIQKTQGTKKKKTIFLVFLGVLHGFSRKSNDDELSWKSKGGWKPLEQIQKNTGSKKKQFFWFSLGVLHGFCWKSNEDEFSQKSNGEWRPLEQIQKTQGAKKSKFFGFPWGFCMDFVGNQMRMNFPRNRMGNGDP